MPKAKAPKNAKAVKKAKPQKRQLKPPKKVQRIWFSTGSNGKRVRIGGFHYADIYIGRMVIDGKNHRVAIKVFKAHEKLSDRRAKIYQSTINDLWKAGVMLPKTGMYKLPKEGWVQVSQLFGSVKKYSKIVNKSHLDIKSAKGRREAVEQSIKVANAGYFPALDLIEPFENRKKGIIPIDLDSVVKYKIMFGTKDPDKRALFVLDAVETIAQPTSNAEYKKLLGVALEHASPEMKKALKDRIVE